MKNVPSFDIIFDICSYNKILKIFKIPIRPKIKKFYNSIIITNANHVTILN